MMSPSITSAGAVLLMIGSLAECIIVPTGLAATSYASIVRGDGSRFGYDISHASYPYGGIEGESYPHGYGGLPAAYAPGHGYGELPFDGYLKEPLLLHEAPFAIPDKEYPYGHAPYGSFYGPALLPPLH